MLIPSDKIPPEVSMELLKQKLKNTSVTNVTPSKPELPEFPIQIYLK